MSESRKSLSVVDAHIVPIVQLQAVQHMHGRLILVHRVVIVHRLMHAVGIARVVALKLKGAF